MLCWPISDLLSCSLHIVFPALPFSSTERDARGSGPGDLIDSMVEGRVVLEKIKVLES
ncbi:hypothetical protein SERLA73DRAFT_141470, partial [Serpula lacrymans var. lacrymans S7.3]